jgi:hypothetical protein
VCEVSHSARKKDTTTVYETLESAGVPVELEMGILLGDDPE